MPTAQHDLIPAVPTGSVRVLLRLENLALAAAAILAFRQAEGGWWLFAIVFLLPDVSMLAYLAGPVVGAVGYNLAHSYIAPALLAAVAWTAGEGLWLQIGLIWIAHIGIDRALGFGLKFPRAFIDTHLGRLRGGRAGR